MNMNIKNIGIITVSLLSVLALFAYFFSQINIQNNSLAIDWKNFYPSLQGGSINYSSIDGILFPPWAVFPLLILACFPMQIAWGILAGISVIILMASIPQNNPRILNWLSILVLLLSFPALRNIADGNVESFVIGGLLLIFYGYRLKQPITTSIGIILASIKFQEVSLLFLALGLFILLTWRSQIYVRAFLFLLAAVSLSLLWRGRDWFHVVVGAGQKYSNSFVNITLPAASTRLALPVPLFLGIWLSLAILTVILAWKSRPHLSRELAGLLITSSILLSPYAATNSVLTIFAIGVIPFFQANYRLGWILILLYNLPFVFSSTALYYFQATYWTVILLITWLLLAIHIQTTTASGKQSTDADQANPSNE